MGLGHHPLGSACSAPRRIPLKALPEACPHGEFFLFAFVWWFLSEFAPLSGGRGGSGVSWQLAVACLLPSSWLGWQVEAFSVLKQPESCSLQGITWLIGVCHTCPEAQALSSDSVPFAWLHGTETPQLREQLWGASGFGAGTACAVLGSCSPHLGKMQSRRASLCTQSFFGAIIHPSVSKVFVPVPRAFLYLCHTPARFHCLQQEPESSSWRQGWVRALFG